MLPRKTAIYVSTQPVDLRRSFDGLAAAARDHLNQDPKSGALFLFPNRERDRMKVLWWDRTGYCILYKRLERGAFRVPSALEPKHASVSIGADELAKILEGIDLPRARKRKMH